MKMLSDALTRQRGLRLDANQSSLSAAFNTGRPFQLSNQPTHNETDFHRYRLDYPTS
jgi:hypothetical protein